MFIKLYLAANQLAVKRTFY